jgi:hypothetical protein
VYILDNTSGCLPLKTERIKKKKKEKNGKGKETREK